MQKYFVIMATTMDYRPKAPYAARCDELRLSESPHSTKIKQIHPVSCHNNGCAMDFEHAISTRDGKPRPCPPAARPGCAPGCAPRLHAPAAPPPALRARAPRPGSSGPARPEELVCFMQRPGGWQIGQHLWSFHARKMACQVHGEPATGPQSSHNGRPRPTAAGHAYRERQFSGVRDCALRWQAREGRPR